MKVRLRHPRKLLSASIGVAAISYMACGTTDVVANLVAPPPSDGSTNPPDDAATKDVTTNHLDVIANLVVAPFDAGPDRAGDAPTDVKDSAPTMFDVIANLDVRPPPDDVTADRRNDAPSDPADSSPNALDVIANLVIAPPADANEQ